MDKIQLKAEQLRRICFGTHEYSKTSGICRKCELNENCRKKANRE